MYKTGGSESESEGVWHSTSTLSTSLSICFKVEYRSTGLSEIVGKESRGESVCIVIKSKEIEAVKCEWCCVDVCVQITRAVQAVSSTFG